MGTEEIKNTANKLITDINKAEKELTQLREECKHQEYDVKQINNEIKKVCKFCKQSIGYPTQQELEESGYV